MKWLQTSKNSLSGNQDLKIVNEYQILQKKKKSKNGFFYNYCSISDNQ